MCRRVAEPGTSDAHSVAFTMNLYNQLYFLFEKIRESFLQIPRFLITMRERETKLFVLRKYCLF